MSRLAFTLHMAIITWSLWGKLHNTARQLEAERRQRYLSPGPERQYLADLERDMQQTAGEQILERELGAKHE